MRNKKLYQGALALSNTLLIGLVSSSVAAMTVQPMVKEISPTGRSSQYSIHIDNPSSKALTIELIPRRIEISRQGEEKWSAADDELLVIPVTAIIQPGKSQTVMVQYIGDPAIEHSKAFRVSVKQVSIDLSGTNQQAIGIGVNFNTLLNVAPQASTAQLSVKSLKPVGNKWQMELQNSGDRYARVTRTNWTFTSRGGAQQQFTGKQIKSHLNGNLVLPHSTRVFTMTPVNNISLNQLERVDIQVAN